MPKQLKKTALLAALMCMICLSAVSQTTTPEDLIGQARQAYNARRFQEAAEAYGRYLSTYPDGQYRDEAGFFHGQSLFLERRYEEAEKVFKNEEGRNRAYADQILYYLGEIASLTREHDRALVYFDRLLAEYPDSMMASRARSRRAEQHFRLGDRYFSEGAFSLALQNYERAEGAPKELAPVVKYRLGLCQMKMKKNSEAVETWGDLALYEGEEGGEAAILARYRLARLLEETGFYSESELSYESFLSSAPDHLLAPLAREGRARVWAKSGNIDKAVEYWKTEGQGKESVRLSDSYRLALDHFVYEEYKDGAAAFSTLAATSEDPDLAWSARLWLARTYAEDGLVARAVKEYEKTVSDNRAGGNIKVEHAHLALKVDPGKAHSIAGSLIRNAGDETLEEARAVSALALLGMHDEKGLDEARQYLTIYPDGGSVCEVALALGLKLKVTDSPQDATGPLKTAKEKCEDPEKKSRAATALADVYRLGARMDSAISVLENAEKEVGAKAGQLAGARAEVLFDKGEYEKGAAVYAELCGDTAVDCGPRTGLRMFWGLFRAEKRDRALSVLDKVAEKGGKWEYEAGFMRGLLFLSEEKPEEAYSTWASLSPSSDYEKALLAWYTARAQELGGSPNAAMQTLSSASEEAMKEGFYFRGETLKLSLESGDYQFYLSALPDPEKVDREMLTGGPLLERMDQMAQKDATPAELERVNFTLQVVATSEEVREEGTMIVARSGLYGPGRPEALAMMDKLLADHPNSVFAEEIRFYKGEDAFLRKDFTGTLSWLMPVAEEDLPGDLAFKLLYMKGQANKELRRLDDMRPFFLAMVDDHYGEGDAREWLNAGIGLTLVSEFTAAKKALELAEDKGDSSAFLAEVLYWKGMVQRGSGDLDGALSTFLTVYEKYPDQGMWTTTALYEAAGVHQEKGEYDEALELYKKVLKMSKGDRRVTDRVKAKIAEVKKLKRLENPLFKR